jgi:4'-phosphopantetheinyl transferase
VGGIAGRAPKLSVFPRLVSESRQPTGLPRSPMVGSTERCRTLPERGSAGRTAERLWNPPPPGLEVTSNEVHVWRARLDLRERSRRGLERLLAADERQRAARFRLEASRSRYVACRGLLRTIIARYVDADPRALRFGYGPGGKPELIGRGAVPRVRFNVTHSEDLALFAVAGSREVGIDVERIKSDLVVQPLVRRFFSPREQTAFERADDKWESFFSLWTAKEAYVKATGAGFSEPRGDAREAAGWSLRELSPGAGYAAALAVEGHNWKLHLWECPPP